MHPLYYYIWAWLLLIGGCVLCCLYEVVLKKVGLWERVMAGRLWYVPFSTLIFTAVAFITLGSHGLIEWCVVEGATLPRCIAAVVLGAVSVPAGVGLWILLSMIIPDNLFGVGSEMGRNLP